MQLFGRTPDGRPARLFTLRNAGGFRADISDYGGTLVRLFAPDRRGNYEDVALGFNAIADYVRHAAYFGALIGRCGNRIARGEFTLDGATHRLATNNRPGGQPCHLHGGTRGFDRVVWTAEPIEVDDGSALRLRYRSAEGEEGYPGNLDVTVTYTLGADNSLRLDYGAKTDRATPVNLTNHTYFNLAGEGRGDVLGHELTVRAGSLTAVDAGLIPTGNFMPVEGTPFDFRTPQPIGRRIDEDHEQLHHGGGYDHNFVLHGRGDQLTPAATVHEPTSGRVMEVLTTEPGVQFYSGNFLDGTLTGKSGQPYRKRAGFCLETQHFPDSPNQPTFPSTILRVGQELRSTTVYRFSAR